MLPKSEPVRAPEAPLDELPDACSGECPDDCSDDEVEVVMVPSVSGVRRLEKVSMNIMCAAYEKFL